MPTTLTGLLVSVRSGAEGRLAVEAGVDLLDVKEPSRGSLGRADRRAIEEAAAWAADRVPLSVALGELRDAPDCSNLLPGVAFAKLGLAGCRDWPDWPRRWQAALDQLPAGVVSVAVAYADWEKSAAPLPSDVLREGARRGCGAALLDTFHKQTGGLFDCCDHGEVADWIALARSLGMRTVLAGSLTLATVDQAAKLHPDYIAVRGAACRGGRAGELDAGRIVELRRQLTRGRVSPRLDPTPLSPAG